MNNLLRLEDVFKVHKDIINISNKPYESMNNELRLEDVLKAHKDLNDPIKLSNLITFWIMIFCAFLVVFGLHTYLMECIKIE